jgi:hypothetical protein
MMRRFVGMVTVTTVIVAAMAVGRPALADDLEDYLERAAEAEYAGRQVVMTVWEGRSIAQVTALEHTRSVTMVERDGLDTVVGDGKVSIEGAAGVALSGWSEPDAEMRYAAGEERDVEHLGRNARSVAVMEGDIVRATIVFDIATWAPLSTEIYDGEGELFRLATFMEFDASPDDVYVALDDDGYDYDLVRRMDESSLPDVAGGYARIDAYAGPDEAAQAFYSDGLFSFSVFEVAPQRARRQFAAGDSLEFAGGRYLVLVEPSEIWVMWERDGAGYVLVGDLPPDHLAEVLADLPAPKGRNLLQRILSFFG